MSAVSSLNSILDQCLECLLCGGSYASGLRPLIQSQFRVSKFSEIHLLPNGLESSFRVRARVPPGDPFIISSAVFLLCPSGLMSSVAQAPLFDRWSTLWSCAVRRAVGRLHRG